MKRLARAATLALLGLLVAAGAHAGKSITGVCPDGSMFVVQRAADIPCPAAKQVDPHDLPPIRPTYLPRPYGWQVFQNKQDPNNPYNLVDRAQTIREAGEPIDDPTAQPPERPTPQPQQHAALPPVSVAPRPARGLELSDRERRDLASIIELTQSRTGARLSDPDDVLVIELAHSQAFAARLAEHYRDERLGPVLLFRARARMPAVFHPNFTFVQGHDAYHPGSRDPKQLGLLAGSFGSLGEGEAVLGYAVLPEGTDLAQPLDIYWNDRRISVVITP